MIGNLLYVIWVLFFMKHRRKLDLIRFTQSASERSNLIQIITAMHEIKLNNSEEHQLKRWKEIQLNLFDINEKSLILGQYQQLGTIFFSQTTTLIISFISARAVIHGSMTLGMMMAISYIIGVLASPISQIINFIQMTQDASISLERLDEIYNIDDEEQAISSQKDYHCQNESLFLKNVDFSYDGSSRNLTLNGVNIKIPNNKVTAIVGASGSGKTTIMKLLLGFYKPLKGEILIGKELLDNINPYQWRKSLGAVMQDGYIFSDTITNNIILSGAFDEEKFNKAINIANIKEYIDLLPLKANTKIGLEGVGISLGQKQRLLIARAVYKNPDYLFFDEATNSLDTKNERTIMDNLNEFYKGRTVVIVAHRLSTVQSADKIIVIDKGKVIEEGTHTELIQKQRAYFSLVRDQLELNKSLY